MLLKKILLIVSGGVAAYKSPEIVRKFKSINIDVKCILTSGGANFITPLTLQTVSGNTVYKELFSLTEENEMGHIRLSRDADMILVAPASANLIANLAHGLTHDLATTVLLASNKPVVLAPSMNIKMWENLATQENIRILNSRGIIILGPTAGDMACGEYGIGRMLEPRDIIASIKNLYNKKPLLAGLKALVTSGPTFEAIDVMRYIGNHSSGKQGHAIARALADLGADTKLISGPTNQPNPKDVECIKILSAKEMLAACEASLPRDIIVCAAAVSDWRVKNKKSIKIKKDSKKAAPHIQLTENPDILATLSNHSTLRPRLIIGFAAETNNIIMNAKQKHLKKGCDWIIANDISKESKTIAGDENQIHLISSEGVKTWPSMDKNKIGEKLALLIADYFESHT